MDSHLSSFSCEECKKKPLKDHLWYVATQHQWWCKECCEEYGMGIVPVPDHQDEADGN